MHFWLEGATPLPSEFDRQIDLSWVTKFLCKMNISIGFCPCNSSVRSTVPRHDLLPPICGKVVLQYIRSGRKIPRTPLRRPSQRLPIAHSSQPAYRQTTTDVRLFAICSQPGGVLCFYLHCSFPLLLLSFPNNTFLPLPPSPGPTLPAPSTDYFKCKSAMRH